MRIMKFSYPLTLGQTLLGLLGLLLLALLIVAGGSDLLAAFSAASVLPALAAILISMLLYPITALRWALITDAVAGRKVASQWQYLYVRVFSGAGGFLVPRELAEIGGRTLWLNKARHLPLPVASQAVLLDRLFDLLISLVSLLSVSLFLTGSATAPFALMVTATMLVALVVFVSNVVRVLRATVKWQSLNLKRVFKRFSFLDGKLDVVLSTKSVPDHVWRIAMFLSVLKFSLLSVRIILLASAVGITFPIAEILCYVPVGQLAYLVAITPGGLGIYDAGWMSIWLVNDVAISIASAFVVILRSTLLVSICLLVVGVWVIQLFFNSSESAPGQ